MSQILIAPVTGAATYTMKIPKEWLHTTIQVDGSIDGAEKVEVEQLDTDQQWRPIFIGGNALVLTPTNTQISFSATNKIRLKKSITAAAVGVQLIADHYFGENEESDSPSVSISSSPSSSISSSPSSSPSAS